MKRIVLIALLSFLISSVSAQWEYTYFAIKTGFTTTYTTPQQTTAPYIMSVNESGNYVKLFSAKELKLAPEYNLNFRPFVSFLLNYDFTNDRGGLLGGINYTSFTLSQNFYEEKNPSPQLTRNITVHSVGLPLLLKLGKGIFDMQRYFFVGAQLNLNQAITIKEMVPWSNQAYSRTVTSNQFQSQNLQFIIGFNYLVFNIELDYQPNNFLNKNYVDANNVPIYSQQKDDIIYFKTSMTFPFTPWLSTKSYWLYKLKQKLTFW